eukprot:GHVR01130326.1.p1 GENE.GHVR01130326.1~~GHVR01130326.1.p1  ORF type:complete len:153 (+),score=18.33 GHVR01130326.1:199-657(+)
MVGASGVREYPYKYDVPYYNLFFINKALKYSKKKDGITVNIVQTKDIKTLESTITHSNPDRIYEIEANSEWAFMEVYGFDMTNERTYMDLDILKGAIPNICLGLDENRDEIINSTKVNPNVVLRSIALGIFPPEDTQEADASSLENFMNSDL